METLRIEVHRSLTEVAPRRGAMDALNLASRRPSPFDTFAYLRAFVDHDEHAVRGQEPLILLAFAGDTLIGWLALRRVPERIFGVPYHAVRFLCAHDTDRPRVIARPEDEARCAEAFYRHLLERERGFSLLFFQEQDDASALDAVARSDLRHHVRRLPNNPNGTIELPSSLAAYLGTFSRTHRRNVERPVRRLLETGDLAVVSSRDPAAVPALLDLYLDLERRSWKSHIGGHIGRDPRRVAFFRALLDPAQPMKVGVLLIVLDGVPIAGVVSGAFEGRLYGLEIAFDEGYKRFSPGNAALLLALREAVEEGFHSIDLLGNYAYYKARWHATITETRAVEVHRRAGVTYLKAILGDLRRRLRPPVTQADVAFNLQRKDAADDAEAEDGALPDRAAERARAAAVLAEIAPRVLAGEALLRALPFEVKRAAAPPRRAREARP